jgi:hypothetical protein
MPLADFVAEVFDILDRNPRVEEILVKRVHGHRFAAESGRESYDAFFQQYNRRSRSALRLEKHCRVSIRERSASTASPSTGKR